MKLFDQVRNEVRKSTIGSELKNSIAAGFMLFQGKKHPKEMDEKEIAGFISYWQWTALLPPALRTRH